MAHTTLVQLTDDIDGGPALARHTLSVDGRTVEIDLSARNWEAFMHVAEPLLRAGRRVPARRAASRSASVAAARREELARARAWGRANGYAVRERGRVPVRVMAAWREELAGAAL